MSHSEAIVVKAIDLENIQSCIRGADDKLMAFQQRCGNMPQIYDARTFLIKALEIVEGISEVANRQAEA